MEYKLYHENVIRRHRVMLMGWPQNMPFKNLSECSSSLQELQGLLERLLNGETYWKTITDDELDQLEDERKKRIEDGEIAPPAPRRRRSDYGKTKKRKQDDVSSSDKDSDPPRKRRKRKYKSTPTVDNDEDSGSIHED